MASKNRPCVSITGALYQRFAAECDAQDAPIGLNVSAIINAALDELESDPDARARFIAEMKAQRGNIGLGTVDISVKGPTADVLGMLRRRTGMTNSQLVAAMLDKAGAP